MAIGPVIAMTVVIIKMGTSVRGALNLPSELITWNSLFYSHLPVQVTSCDWLKRVRAAKCFSWGKIYFEGFPLCKRIDIVQLCKEGLHLRWGFGTLSLCTHSLFCHRHPQYWCLSSVWCDFSGADIRGISAWAVFEQSMLPLDFVNLVI